MVTFAKLQRNTSTNSLFSTYKLQQQSNTIGWWHEWFTSRGTNETATMPTNTWPLHLKSDSSIYNNNKLIELGFFYLTNRPSSWFYTEEYQMNTCDCSLFEYLSNANFCVIAFHNRRELFDINEMIILYWKRKTTEIVALLVALHTVGERISKKRLV